MILMIVFSLTIMILSDVIIKEKWQPRGLLPESVEISGQQELVMGDEDTEYVPTLEGQFASFAKMLGLSRETITLYCSDYWMRQSNIIDDRLITMTDTGVVWCNFSKAELNWDEWQEYLAHICAVKGLNKLEIEAALTNCGLPGATRVNVPQYRDFFNTYKPKNALIICESLDSCGKPKKKPKPT